MDGVIRGNPEKGLGKIIRGDFCNAQSQHIREQSQKSSSGCSQCSQFNQVIEFLTPFRSFHPPSSPADADSSQLTLPTPGPVMSARFYPPGELGGATKSQLDVVPTLLRLVYVLFYQNNLHSKLTKHKDEK